MACCCRSGKSNKSSTICLGRCDLPKHKCLERKEHVPKNMGWLYTAKNSPEHQLRCGWRPGHISCSVLRKIEQHNCMRASDCTPCPSSCSRPCTKPCYSLSKCMPVCSSPPSCCRLPACGPFTPQPIIRIIRHAGQYSICTKPSNINNSPSGPYPLKYVLNAPKPGEDSDYKVKGGAKFSVEAKFNDYHFDYTCSQTSFILDFSPPEQKCYKPCPKKSIPCVM